MSDVQPRCPYCLADLAPGEEVVRCTACRTPHHADCFQEHGGCVAYGCRGHDDVAAGASVFERPVIRIRPRLRTHEVPLGPFSLRVTAAPVTAASASAAAARPALRLGLQRGEVRAGDTVLGRAVASLGAPLPLKRLELVLSQGLRRPEVVARTALVGAGAGALLEGALVEADELPAGKHPFELALRAPDATPPVDPFLLELVLVKRGFLAETLRSSTPLALFLLQRTDAAAGDLGSMATPPAQAVAPAPEEGREAGAPGGWREVPIVRAGSLHATGAPTGRRALLRLAPAGASAGGVALSVSPVGPSLDLPARVDVGGRLTQLTLALHTEVVRPGGGQVPTPGLPVTEEARVVGAAGALPPGTQVGRLELRWPVPRERLDALARARAEVKNAALRLTLALDALDPRGRVAPCAPRSVTLTEAPPP